MQLQECVSLRKFKSIISEWANLQQLSVFLVWNVYNMKMSVIWFIFIYLATLSTYI